MKIWKINKTDYYVYDYSSNISTNNLYTDVENIFKKLQKLLKLQGFYKVNVIIRKIGVFFKIICLEKAFYKDTLDLKIEEDKDSCIYYCTEDYFIVSRYSSVIFFNGLYYVLVDDNFDFSLDMIEFGYFVFGFSIL